MPLLPGKSRGYYVERKLVKMLSKKGNYVFRVPVSGSRGPINGAYAFPDVFLINNKKDLIVAFEVKGTKRKKVRIRREQLIKLARFLEPFKKYSKREAVVAVWFFNNNKWVFKKINNLLEVEKYLTISSNDSSNWNP